MEGYFKISRNALENALYNEKPFDRWHAWEYLIAWAAWKAHKKPFMGRQFHLRRGQLVTTKNQLRRDWGWSWDKVERFLGFLAAGKDPMITVEDASRVAVGRGANEDPTAESTGSTSGSSTGRPVILVTLCKYKLYQGDPEATGSTSGRSLRKRPGSGPGADREQAGSRPGTTEEREERKKGKGGSAPPPPSVSGAEQDLPTPISDAPPPVHAAGSGPSPTPPPSDRPERSGEEQEVEATVEAFSAFLIPGAEGKRDAVVDLRRQGVSHARIREMARANPKADFFAIVKDLRNGRTVEPAAPAPKTGPPCPACAGKGGKYDEVLPGETQPRWRPCAPCKGSRIQP